MASVTVLGAGVVGLSTAVCIQERFPYVKVTIIADKFDQETTSDGAGGMVAPRSSPIYIPGVPEETIRRWTRDSLQRFDRIAHSAEAAEAGAVLLSGYELYEKPVPMPTFHDVVPHCRVCTEKELNSFPVKYPFGIYVNTVLVECRRYLPWLMNKFRKNGGTVIKRRIEKLEELVGTCDVVVNCTGYGSKQLLGDNKLQEQRGFLIRVEAPWIKQFVRMPARSVSVFPCFDTVVLGAPKTLGDTSLSVTLAESEELQRKCRQLVPSLKDARILKHWVGFRPFRDPIRLETEIRQLENGKIKMVHNYGHGGAGVALSWGTAVEATDLLQTLLVGTSRL